MEFQECMEILEKAELIHDEMYCEQQLQKISQEISVKLESCFPLVLSIMGGAIIFTGKLLPLLKFPLEFDYIHVSRYHNQLFGNELKWFKYPKKEKVVDKTVLIVDDILDEGHTLLEVKSRVLELGARNCYTAVFANKILEKEKPVQADFIALDVPNKYVFGYGMDVKGCWRNLLAIYALKE